jgi:hypothetical protein
MSLTEWRMTDDTTYHKHQDEIDALIIGALTDGPKPSHELMELLRHAGFGNAQNNGALELSYSMTGAIYRSAKNSLRARGLICDSWDVFTETGAKVPPLQVMRRPDPQQEATHA